MEENNKTNLSNFEIIQH